MICNDRGIRISNGFRVIVHNVIHSLTLYFP